MKLISWNVNGIRACVGKNFMEFFNEVNADRFCLQETKLQENQIDLQSTKRESTHCLNVVMRAPCGPD